MIYAMIGAWVFFAVVWVATRKKCPDCLRSSHYRASVCRHCLYRWK